MITATQPIPAHLVSQWQAVPNDRANHCGVDLNRALLELVPDKLTGVPLPELVAPELNEELKAFRNSEPFADYVNCLEMLNTASDELAIAERELATAKPIDQPAAQARTEVATRQRDAFIKAIRLQYEATRTALVQSHRAAVAKVTGTYTEDWNKELAALSSAVTPHLNRLRLIALRGRIREEITIVPVVIGLSPDQTTPEERSKLLGRLKSDLGE